MAYSITSITPIGTMGGMKLAIVKISPDAATETTAFAAYCKDEVIPLTPPNFIEAMTANCYTAQAVQNSTTKTSIDFALWRAGGSAATAYLDFTLLVAFKDSAADLATL
jgi:hypothetical protein